MADTLALEYLRTTVIAQFAADGTFGGIAGGVGSITHTGSGATVSVSGVPTASGVGLLTITGGGGPDPYTFDWTYGTASGSGDFTLPDAMLGATGLTATNSGGILVPGDTFAWSGTASTYAQAAAAANPFGWREPSRQGGPNSRIVWTPGDLGGRVGDIAGPRYPGGLPARALASLWELFTCRISYFDPAHPDDELLQWKGARLLYDAWLRAVYLAVHGNYEIREQSWDNAHNERRSGACIQVVGAILSVIPDADADLAPTDTGGDLTVTELDVSEHVIVEAP